MTFNDVVSKMQILGYQVVSGPAMLNDAACVHIGESQAVLTLFDSEKLLTAFNAQFGDESIVFRKVVTIN